MNHIVMTPRRMSLCAHDGQELAHARLVPVHAGLVRIEAVYVDPKHRGQGIDEELMHALLSRLKEEGRCILAVCPTARRYLARHPKWSCLLPQDIHFETH